jgi:hypothetical protein
LLRSILAVVTLLAGAEAAGAQPSGSPVYAVGRIRATGGSEIRGNPQGVLLDRSFGSDCSLPPADLNALAGSLGAGIRLELKMIACPASAPPPAVRCEARVGDARSWVRFEGYEHSLPLALPRLTGQLGLDLSCETGTRPPEPLSAAFYLTFRPPLKLVNPPPEDWYRQAASWGAGLDAAATETQVVAQILARLYSHGQRHWRYGYCRIEGNRCVFGATSLPFPPDPGSGLECFPQYHVCRCSWGALVEGRGGCNFGDCFIFSDALYYLSAVMGVGGLTNQQVFGRNQQGFATAGWIRSLDPAFPGNYSCVGDRACSYLFFNHDLLTRGHCPSLSTGLGGGPLCQIFDPTFGRVYSNLGELIGASADDWNLNVEFPQSRACLQRSGYGLFLFYRETPKSGKVCPLQAGLIGAQFTTAAPRLVPSTQGLAVGVDVEVVKAGSYWLLGVLFASGGGREKAVVRSHYRLVGPLSFGLVEGGPGLYTATMFFSGADFTPGREYYLSAVIEAAGGDQSSQRFVRVDAPEGGDFSERPAEILPGPPHVERIRQRDGSESLRVELRAKVRQAGDYFVESRLFSGTTTLAYGGEALRLEPGEVEIPIEIPGAEIAAHGIDGEYLVTVTLHHQDPLFPVDSATFEIGTYRAASFGAVPPR